MTEPSANPHRTQTPRPYRPDHKAVPRHPFRTLIRYCQPYWRRYLTGAALALCFVGIELTVPIVFSTVVKQAMDRRLTAAHLWLYFAVLLSIALAAGIARYWQRVLMIGASRKLEFDIRNDYFRHVQSLSRDFFHRIKTGDIMARATNDLNFIRLFAGPGIMGTVDMIRLPLTLAIMTYFSPRLTLLVLMPLPLVSLFVYSFVMYTHRQSKRVQEQFSVVTARAQENLAGARVVKAYGTADRELRDFTDESAKYMREGIKLSAVMVLTWPLISLFIGGIVLLILWRGGGMVIDGHLSFGNMSGFIVCLFMLTWPLAQLGWILTLYQRGAVGMSRMLDIFVEEPAVRDDTHTRHDLQSIRGAVRFDRVHFAYNGQAVLHDISFEIPLGQTVAIVGPTGSGKTTIVSLLAREYDPTSGTVLIDGTDARQLPLSVLRGSVGCVPQDTLLFSDSIRENLTFGRQDAAQDDIDRAVEIAQFRETVDSLPNGYETLLGERGVNLSGGQKQRLAIARAIVLDPRILVLDDALSSVDTHTEEEILVRLREVTAARTSVIVSHRVSTIRHADQILVVKDGRIVERGRHEDLIQRDGEYADMNKRQQLERALEEEA